MDRLPMKRPPASSDTTAGARKTRKMALGRGLDALLPDGGGPQASRDFQLCPLDQIRPNRFQPRRTFGEEELAELADSIRAQGIIQPLIVRRDTGGFELVAGERRLRAARLAGLDRVPVVVKELSDAEMLEMSIVENIQRENLNPIEEADAYHRLMAEFHLTQDQAAERVGKSRSAVANFLRLRQLPEAIKKHLAEGLLTMGHARALLGLDDPVERLAAWKAVVARKLSVRETENLVRRMKTTPRKPQTPPEAGSEQRHLDSLAEDLARLFGTKVRIQRRGRRGTVEIEFYDNQDLDRLLSLLKPV
jgi:ParB family chromosome partitioning protein